MRTTEDDRHGNAGRKGGPGRRRHRGAGRGIAVELGAAGAHVYVTGRSTREPASEYGRPETIEETAELVTDGRRHGDRRRRRPPRAGRRSPSWWRGSSATRVGSTSWSTTSGAARSCSSGTRPLWEHDLDKGLRLLRLAVDTHLITSHHALPLLIRRPGGLVVEMTDGTAEYNATNYRVSAFYDLAKSRGAAAGLEPGPRARRARLHRGRAHAGLDALGDDARELRRHRGELARGADRPVSRRTPTRGTSASPRRPGSPAGRWSRWPPIRTWPGGTRRRCRRGSWPGSTGSPTSTAASPTRGATSSRCRTPACLPILARIGEPIRAASATPGNYTTVSCPRIHPQPVDNCSPVAWPRARPLHRDLGARWGRDGRRALEGGHRDAAVGHAAAPPPPPAGEMRKISVRYRCDVCGVELKMTLAPDDDPPPPKHCLEDMIEVAPLYD